MTSGAATQVASRTFDYRFFALPPETRSKLQSRIDSMGLRLTSYPHFQMQGADTFRLRIGDYRIVYQFNIERTDFTLLQLATDETFTIGWHKVRATE